MGYCRYNMVAALLFIGQLLSAQQTSVFKRIPLDSIGVKVYQVYPTIEGGVIFTSSIGLWSMKGRQMHGPEMISDIVSDKDGRPIYRKIRLRSVTAEDSIRAVAQAKDSLVYFVSHDNRFFFRFNGLATGFGWAPFNFPNTSRISRIWIDDDNTLYAGTISDNFYVIKEAAIKRSFWGVEYDGDRDSNCIVTKGALPVKHISISPGASILSFAQDVKDKNIVWVGTNKGLYYYNKVNDECRPAVTNENTAYTVTEINTRENELIWFSTLEKGMAVFNSINKTVRFFPYPRTQKDNIKDYAVTTFCYKSPHQFFVAVKDSFPAIFNTNNGKYIFFADSILSQSENETEGISVDHLGNLLLVRNGVLYISDVSKSDLLRTSVIQDTSLQAPYILSISLFSGEELASIWNNPEFLKRIVLKHHQNKFIVRFGVNDFTDRRDVVYAYTIEGYSNGWMETIRSNNDETNFLSVQDLKPGEYTLLLKARIGKRELEEPGSQA